MTGLITISAVLLGLALIVNEYNLYQAIKRIEALEKRIDELERIVWRLE